MANSNWNVTNFLAQVSAKGLAKPNRFEVTINTPACLRSNTAGQQVSMMCDQALLPYTRVLTSRQQIFGPPSFHPVGVDYNGEGISLQFYVDREMMVKKFFDGWVDGIIDRTTFTASYQENYLTTILISQLDEADLITYQVKLIDAFPVTVQALTLDASAVNQPHRLSVNFNFRKWIEVSPPNGGLGKPDASKTVPEQNLRIRNGSVEYNMAPNFSTKGGEYVPLNGGYTSDQYFIVK